MTISTQHLIDRVRKPRVHITYDVQIGNAIEKKELPFVVGILANLSGMPKEDLPKVRDRKFVYIDQENFDEVFEAAHPSIQYDVKDTLNPGPDGRNVIHLDLEFKSIHDFEPINIVSKIPQLSGLFNEKVMMKDLLAKAEGNSLLHDILKLIAEDPDTRNSLKQVVKAALPQFAPKEEKNAEAQKQHDEDIANEIKADIKAAEAKKRAKTGSEDADAKEKDGAKGKTPQGKDDSETPSDNTDKDKS